MSQLILRFSVATALAFTFALPTIATAQTTFTPCDTEVDCDDGNACTQDSCFIPDGACGDANQTGDITAVDALHVLRTATGLTSMCRPSVCDVDGSGSITATDALRVLADAVGVGAGILCRGECLYDPITCDDGDVCNGQETCDAESGCVEGTPLDCDDQDACTTDVCDDSNGCLHDAITCNDGDACNGTETCDTASGCVAGETVDCDDQNACTVDSCSSEGGCSNEPIECGDGNACNGEETCNPESGCVEGQALDCGDGDACNGDETCDAELGCVAGEALDCDDQNACTQDTCSAEGGCSHEAIGCDDGNACTLDSCSEEGGCAYDPVDCNDGDVCNGEESCDESLGCLAGESLNCDDGLFCNGTEQCDGELGCVEGPAADCSDGDECTVDACDEELDTCAHDGTPAGTMDVISFEGIAEGTILSEVFCDGGAGPIGVYGDNIERFPGTNAALIYDSACSSGACSGDDIDLGTPNETFGGPGVGVGGEAGAPSENSSAQGNLLVVAESLVDVDPADGLVDRPSDQGNDRPVAMTLDFAEVGPVVVKSLTLLDVEATEDPAIVELYGAAGELLASIVLPQTGNNGSTVVDLEPVAGVWSMTVKLFGSGAIDDVVLIKGECDDAGTTTTTTSTSTTTSSTMLEETTTTTLHEEVLE